jgi:putative ABC transport system permease protein
MFSVLKIAWRNLLRYWRRTLLTAGLITVGVVAVLLFVGLSGSFKSLMIGQFTDSVLGHLEIHKKGYVASLDNLPLNLNLGPKQWERAEAALTAINTVVAYAPRIKFGGLFSNFTETTNIRVNGIDPAKEMVTVPLLQSRIVDGDPTGLLKPGEILVPELMAKGMKVKTGDTVVVVATNRDGSVNGQTFVVRGVVAGISGPGGRDAYIHIDDARRILRLTKPEVSEVLVRLKSLSDLSATVAKLEAAFAEDVNPQGKPTFEVHGWDKLSPFANIAKMIDLMTVFIKAMLVSIVLISIMNVMIMAVYERIREIGTISAIGTPPSRILGLFLAEGLLLGIFGTVVGVVFSLGAIAALNVHKVSFAFGQQDNIVLAPTIAASDVVTACAVVIVVAVLASLQPAWKAARMDPIAALRHV